jgi:hypothetical protein
MLFAKPVREANVVAMPKITVEDWVDISNLLGKYQWLVDDGDEQGWSSLFTEDGFFEGLPPDYHGREELKQIPRMSFGGLSRHLPGSIWMEYGANQDEVFVRLYNLFSVWAPEQEPQFMQFALSRLHLLRIDGEWKIRSNTIKGLRQIAAADVQAMQATETVGA